MDGNNWDLFAVVRGCFPSSTDEFSWFMSSSVVKDEAMDSGLFSFPDVVPISGYSYEPDDLCNTIYLNGEEQKQQARQYHSQQLTNSNTDASMFCAITASPQQIEELKKLQKTVSRTPRQKRSKSQQKKVVCQVPADSVSSDMWAWRKYGQKPIKGSPYPRGYYRCSSLKGCQARKQVERSQANPGMLIITYTAEHNHPMPTHRNSLAGSTRQKFPPPSSTGPRPTAIPSNLGSNIDHLLSPVISPQSSPKTPLTESFEDELFRNKEAVRDEEDNLLSVGDVEMMAEHDMLFLGMEVIGVPAKSLTNTGYKVDDEGNFEDHFLRPSWFAANNNAATAAGGN